MKTPSKPANESQRLGALSSYDILDTLPESVYDNITLLASQICGTPIAAISLIDRDRQWFKSRVGLEVTETPRDISICGHAILGQHDVFEVADTANDPDFADNPLVTGESGINFYAGAPLIAPGGERLGTLCVMDHRPRRATLEQRRALRALGDQVVTLFEARKTSERLREQDGIARDAVATAEKNRVNLNLIFEKSRIGMALVREPDFVFEQVNDAFKHLVSPREYLKSKWADVFHDALDERTMTALKDVYTSGQPCVHKEVRVRVQTPEGPQERLYNYSYDRIEGINALQHGVLIQVVDVTDEVLSRDRALENEAQAREARTRLFETLTSIPTGIAILEGPRHVYSFVNDEHNKFFGGRSDFVG